MNARTIPRTAVNSSLRLVRVPLDAAVGLLPGNGTGARPTARLALDRTDATVRAFAAAIFGDSVLREDAQQRRAALTARQRTQELRGEAQTKTTNADARLEQRHDQLANQRRLSNQRAKAQRTDAERGREARNRRAEESESKRLVASRKTEASAEKAVSERAPKPRLGTLGAKTDALRENEHTRTARDEGRRLAAVTSRTKAKRKNK